MIVLKVVTGAALVTTNGLQVVTDSLFLPENGEF
jgi:hypothetical protein